MNTNLLAGEYQLDKETSIWIDTGKLTAWLRYMEDSLRIEVYKEDNRLAILELGCQDDC